ncbi:hypothetical protein Emag_005101 [Eimeria magna]
MRAQRPDGGNARQTQPAATGALTAPTTSAALRQHQQRQHQQQEAVAMGDISEGQLAVVSQLLLKLRSLRTPEAAGLVRALGRRAGSPSFAAVEAFVDKCNRRLQCSGMQIQQGSNRKCLLFAGFDGEASAYTLRSLPGAELPREEQHQKTGPKLHFMGDADVACAAELFDRIMRTRAAVPLPAFVRLCAEHRVPSAPQLLRWLLELRWVEAEAAACASDGRQLTLGPSFYLDVLPRLEGWTLPACAICKQPSLLQVGKSKLCAALQQLPRRVPPGLHSRDAQQAAAAGAPLPHLLLLRRSLEACMND